MVWVCVAQIKPRFGKMHKLHSGSAQVCNLCFYFHLCLQKGDDGEEGVTSEEFDKFLEERAKAAETAPGLPTPPGGELGAQQGTPSRKKTARPEDALFAM